MRATTRIVGLLQKKRNFGRSVRLIFGSNKRITFKLKSPCKN